MKSPADMQIIQVEITNACPHACSNCTRFVGHHRKPFMMDWDTFKLAVDSLREYPGMVGIMGGEPTLHPEFAKFAQYLKQARPEAEPRTMHGPSVAEPIRADGFCEYRNRHWSTIAGHRRGLWTSLGQGYATHFGLIRDVFRYQCVNDHTHAGEHQALLVTRTELGIPDAEWLTLRDRCWIQNLWSASVTPKGAFFCEVAAALDMLTGGPGGWPLEKDWWRRTPDAFGSQLEWCELCGGCLATPKVQANTERDLVSPAWEARLRDLGSRKLAKGQVDILDLATFKHDPSQTNTGNAEPYLRDGDNSSRVVPETVKPLTVQKLDGLTVCVGYGDCLAATLPQNLQHFDRFVVVTSSADTATQKIVTDAGAPAVLVVSDTYQEGGPFNKGRMVNAGLAALDGAEWILITDADIYLPGDLRTLLGETVLNPNCLYYAERRNLPDAAAWLGTRVNRRPDPQTLPFKDPASNRAPWGYFQLFHSSTGQAYSEKFTTAGGVDNEFQNRWPKHMKALLPCLCVHIPHGPLGVNWAGRVTAPLPGREELAMPPPPAPANGWRPIGWIDHNGWHVTGKAPKETQWVRLMRVDTQEVLIGPVADWVREGFLFHAWHIGMVHERHAVAVERVNRGRIIVRRAGGKEWSGWGIGHVMWEDDRQGYCWNGQEIGKTNFEVCVRAGDLTAEDQAQLADAPAPVAVEPGPGAPRGEPVAPAAAATAVDPGQNVSAQADPERRGLAVVVCAVRLPSDVEDSFFRRNYTVLQAVKAEIFVVKDQGAAEPRGPDVHVVKFEPGPVYSPSRASNRGIRTAVDAGYRVVVKTDVDCLLTPRFLEACATVDADRGLCPYYMMAKSVAAEDLATAKKWAAGCGTLALYAGAWAVLRGYDERMMGYGREDGDAFDRARMLGVQVRRAAGHVYHIAHASRQTPDWYPLRRKENIEVGKTPWQTVRGSEEWGR